MVEMQRSKRQDMAERQAERRRYRRR